MGEVEVPYKIADNQTEYELIFGSETSQMPVCFLSSRGANSYYSIAHFGPGVVGPDDPDDGIGEVVSVAFGGLFDSDGDEDVGDACVRSVVSLKSGVTIEQVPKE